MKLLIGYATKEGHTRKIARHIADLAVDNEHAVELISLKDADDVGLSRFDIVLLAAPIHAGRYPKALSAFAADNAALLNDMNTALVSVSLAAAGHDSKEWRSLDQIVGDCTTATGWRPDNVKQVAGAYKPSKYDILTRFIMRKIIAAKDPKAKPGVDKEYTDWADLDAWVTDQLKFRSANTRSAMRL